MPESRTCPACGDRMKIHARGLTRSPLGGSLPKTRFRCPGCGRTQTVYQGSGTPCAGHRATPRRMQEIAAACLAASPAAVARQHGCDAKTVRAAFGDWLATKSADIFNEPPETVAIIRVDLCSGSRFLLADAERMTLRDVLASSMLSDAGEWPERSSPGLVFVEPDPEAVVLARRCWPQVPVAVDRESFLAAARRIVETAMTGLAKGSSPETAAAVSAGFPGLMRDVPFRSLADKAQLDRWRAGHPGLHAIREAKDGFWAVWTQPDPQAMRRALADWEDGCRGAVGRLLWRLRELAATWKEQVIPFAESGLLADWSSDLLEMRRQGVDQAAHLGTRRFDAVRAALLFAHPLAVPVGLPVTGIPAGLKRIAAAQQGRAQGFPVSATVR